MHSCLASNLDYMVFSPVGNSGSSLINGRDVIPDLFDGISNSQSDPQCGSGTCQPLQISPPATAKNSVSVGAVCEDVDTMFGEFNEEENVQNYTSKGPATAASLRTAPIITGVGNDRTPTGGGPLTYGMAVFRSSDNNQDGTVEAILDQHNRGTSFPSGFPTPRSLRPWASSSGTPSGPPSRPSTTPPGRRSTTSSASPPPRGRSGSRWPGRILPGTCWSTTWTSRWSPRPGSFTT